LKKNRTVSVPNKPRRAALINYGCAKNLVDSEVMGGHLLSAGYEIAENPEAADVLILNTCGFIRPSRDEAEEGIRAALAAKKSRPETRVVVTGCYAERDKINLVDRFPEVDAWLGVKDYDNIVAVVEDRPFRPGRRTFLYDHASPRALSTPAGWAYLKISEGCSHECAFCAIPSIKGRYRSRSAASIVAEAQALAARGVRELVLISQDTTYYGRDRGQRDGFARLLERLLRATDFPWIRFLYGYPEEITDRLLDVMTNPRICPYFDIPFQHAAASVLKRMKRSMFGRRALRLLEKIRTRLSEAVIRTSLIVGFPGEGRVEFEELRDFVRQARFDHLGVFTYSKEDGTGAAVLGDPVPVAEKEHRRSVLMEIQIGISASKLKTYIGRTLVVLLESVREDDPRDLVGRTRFQAPEVDGVVFVREVRANLETPLRRVKITSSDVYDLRGTLIS
jgi:ribosomal protein S12 methylthiotransferase